MVTLSMVDRFLHAIESGDQLPSPAAVERGPVRGLPGCGIETEPWFGRQLALCLLGTLVPPPVRAPGRG